MQEIIKSSSKKAVKVIYNMSSIKDKLDKKNFYKSLSDIRKEQRCDALLLSWLSRNGIILRDNGLFIWNKRIPVTHLLADRYLNYSIEYRKKRETKLANAKPVEVDTRIQEEPQPVIHAVKSRKISILWGLFSYEY